MTPPAPRSCACCVDARPAADSQARRRRGDSLRRTATERSEALVAARCSSASPRCSSPAFAGYLLRPRRAAPGRVDARHAAASTADEPDERLPLPPADDEVGRLGETLNEMLVRLEDAVERERDVPRRREPRAAHAARDPAGPRWSSRCARAATTAELRDAIASALRRGRPPDRCSPTSCSSSPAPTRARLPLTLSRADVDLGSRVAAALHRRCRRVGVTLGGSDRPRSRADRCGSSRRSATSSTTRCATAREVSRLGRDRRAGSSCSESPTRAAGFPPGFLERAFDRFARADPARGGRHRARPGDRRRSSPRMAARSAPRTARRRRRLVVHGGRHERRAPERATTRTEPLADHVVAS